MEREQYELLYQCEERMWWFVGMRRIAETLLGAQIRPGLRCLEAGCGTGFNSIYFRQRYGWQVFPFDLSRDALRYAQERGVERLARASLTALPYRDAAFDCATCLDVLALLSEQDGARALRELRRVLKSGGWLLLRTAALESLRGRHSAVSHERRRYSLRELAAAVERAGFRVERRTYANTLLLPVALLKRRVLEPLGITSLEGDVRPTAWPLDRTFRASLRVEDALLRLLPALPIGVSAIVMARAV